MLVAGGIDHGVSAIKSAELYNSTIDTFISPDNMDNTQLLYKRFTLTNEKNDTSLNNPKLH